MAAAVPASYPARLPLVFEPNLGQADREVEYLSRAPGYTLSLRSTEAVLKLQDSGGRQAGSVVRMQLVGANQAAANQPLGRLSGTSSYFVGNNPKLWRTGVPQFEKVRYREVYPGTSLVYYGNGAQLEYDFEVQPGSDPRRIQMRFTGAGRVQLTKGGELLLTINGRTIRQGRPVLYQECDGQRVVIAGRYEWRKNGHSIGFGVGRYDRSKPLIIDPTLLYSTYIGGLNSTSIKDIAVDASGNLYALGTIDGTSFNGSTALGPASGSNWLIVKLNPGGTSVLYSAVIGGSGSDVPAGIAVDSTGNAYVAGYTLSRDFPTTAGAWKTTTGNDDSVVLKLNAAGSALVYSTYLTASASFGPVQGTPASAITGIAVNAQGVAYVTGQTYDPQFPVTPGAYQSTLRTANNINSSDAFVAAMAADGSRITAATLFGSTDFDRATGIALDTSGQPVITGYNGFQGHPGVAPPAAFPTTPGSYKSPWTDGADGFVAKFNAACTQLIFAATLGGDSTDQPNAIALDRQNNVYITGYTASASYSMSGTPLQTTPGAGFVTKLDSSGAFLLYSTYFGSASGGVCLLHATDSGCGGGSDIGVDASGSAYVTGVVPESATVPVTPSTAFFPNRLSADDSFLLRISPTGLLTHGTYWGSTQKLPRSILTNSAATEARAIAVDSAGAVFIAGDTTATNLPVTAGASQAALATETSGFAAKMVLTESTCLLSLTGPTSIPAAGGTGSLIVGADRGCPWVVRQLTSSAGIQLTFTSPTAGVGEQTVTYSLPANPLGSPRFVNLQVGPYNLQVTQDGAACPYTLSAATASVGSAGGNGTVTLSTTTPGCSWIASPLAAWVTIVGPKSGTVASGPTGPYVTQISYTVEANPSPFPRSAAIDISGQSFTIMQAAGTCQFTLGANYIIAPAAGGTFRIPITAQDSSCTWQASPNDPWLTVLTGSGAGSGTVLVSVAAAPASPQRSGSFTIGGKVLNVQQTGPGSSVILTTTGDLPLFDNYFAATVSANTAPAPAHNVTLTATLNAAVSYSYQVSGTPVFAKVASLSGNTPALLTISADPAGLAPGTYTNRINFTTTAGGQAVYTVSLTVQAAGQGGAKAGVFRPLKNLFLVDRNADGVCCSGDLVGSFGRPFDVPLAGDWNGSGTKKIGIFRPAANLFLLDMDGDGQFTAADKALVMDATSLDVPVVGDWTGTGVDRVGIFRAGTWYLDVNGDGTFAGRAYLGQGTDYPLVGDWTGDRKAKVGIYRPYSVGGQPGNFFLIDSNGDGQYTSADRPLFFLGQVGDLPIVGDWSGDGKTKLGVFRPHSGDVNAGMFILDNDGSFSWSGPAVDKVLFFAPLLSGPGTTTKVEDNDIPVTGNWAPSYTPAPAGLGIGQGKTRVGLYRPGTGTFFLDVTADGTFQGRAFLGQEGDVPVGVPITQSGVTFGVNALGAF